MFCTTSPQNIPNWTGNCRSGHSPTILKPVQALLVFDEIRRKHGHSVSKFGSLKMPEIQQEPPHLPVLLDETLSILGAIEDGWVVDATVGFGGHSEAILEDRKSVV